MTPAIYLFNGRGVGGCEALGVLNEARAIGLDIAVDDSDLVLAAARQPLHHVIEALSCHKPEIVALLRPARWLVSRGLVGLLQPAHRHRRTRWQAVRKQAEAFAYESCIIEWINRNPEPSDPTTCAWCRRQDRSDHEIVPLGADGSHHTWFHPECWSNWRQHRKAKAQKALDGLGIRSRNAT